ncbi:PREDICTED: glutathione S-transferase D7 isoform X1 [Rhagoletis zephyria]|uniref:glutathione S-transferase D7 isoform X1 n=2 Tax=Rhagoletis zephyria TaxID=28612 RepID=UPI00081188CD|nr:PREDICTED: glutathione S-transferase D7 isoform X1 [Rhagoletis zephyria]
MLDDTAHIVKEFVYCILSRGGSKMAPTLYYLPPSPPCRSVLLLGKMLGIDFDLKIINILAGEQLKPEFLQLNPQHCIPTIDDEGLVLWESRAILQYLAAAYGKDDSLYPKDVRVRALVDQRIHFDLGTLYARTFDYYLPTVLWSAPLDESKKAKLNEAFNWFNDSLKGHEYAATDNFTIADLTLLVTVSQCEAFGFEIDSYNRVKHWLRRCKDYMQPYDYEELNGSKAVILADMFRAKIENP